jgi:hypothetical protein
VSELAAGEGLGRALGLALVSPGLPIALRHPAHATVARTFGALFVEMATEPDFWRRMRGVGDATAHRVATLARAIFVLETRAQAAALLVDDGASTERRREEATERLSHALGVRLDTPLATLVALTPDPDAAAARLRARVGALAAWTGLRDRFDEDWYRNPRSEEAFRAAAAPGGLLPAEAWLAELRAEPEAAFARLQEWAA